MSNNVIDLTSNECEIKKVTTKKQDTRINQSSSSFVGRKRVSSPHCFNGNHRERRILPNNNNNNQQQPLDSLQLQALLIRQVQLQNQLAQQLTQSLEKTNTQKSNTQSFPSPQNLFGGSQKTITTKEESRRKRLDKAKAKRKRKQQEEKSKIAQAKPRNDKGQFVQKSKIQKTDTKFLENQLACSQEECKKLKKILQVKDEELKRLKKELANQVLINKRQRYRLEYFQKSLPSSPNSPLDEVMKSPSVQSPMDTSDGISLSQDDESSTTCSSFHTHGHNGSHHDFVKNGHKYSLGGPPSEIYNKPHPGNLKVPAFTEKIDYSKVSLKRNEAPPDYLTLARNEYFEGLKRREEDKLALSNELTGSPTSDELNFFLGSSPSTDTSYFPPWFNDETAPKGEETPVPFTEKIDFSGIQERLRKTGSPLRDDSPLSSPSFVHKASNNINSGRDPAQPSSHPPHTFSHHTDIDIDIDDPINNCSSSPKFFPDISLMNDTNSADDCDISTTTKMNAPCSLTNQSKDFFCGSRREPTPSALMFTKALSDPDVNLPFKLLK